jgi:hypothetical protein
MAGTKQSAEAMGFVLYFFFEKIDRNESVGERSALGEALTEVLVDGAEVRMSA